MDPPQSSKSHGQASTESPDSQQLQNNKATDLNHTKHIISGEPGASPTRTSNAPGAPALRIDTVQSEAPHSSNPSESAEPIPEITTESSSSNLSLSKSHPKYTSSASTSFGSSIHSPIPHKIFRPAVAATPESSNDALVREVKKDANANDTNGKDANVKNAANSSSGATGISIGSANSAVSLNSTPAPRRKSTITALKVKADPTLKSCLSPTSDATSTLNSTLSMLPHNESISLLDNTQHPSFLIKSDNISPNKHGLLGINQKGTATPSYDDEHARSHVSYTPLVTSNSASVVSSVPVSPPRNTSKSPPSRMNSLRYSNQDEKRVIESMRLSNNSSLASEERQKSFGSISGSGIGSVSGSFSDPGAGPGAAITEENGPAITSDDNSRNNKLHLLIGITGCISIHKNIFLMIDKFFELYTHDKLEIQVILTKSAEWFLTDKLHKFESLGVKVWFSGDDVKYFLSSPFQKHVALFQNPNSAYRPKLTSNLLSQYSLAHDLQKWTDVFLLAPLSANTMAKLIGGLSDDFLTNLLHVWPIPQSNQTLAVPEGNSTILSNSLVCPKPIVAALALTNSMYSHPITKKQLVLLQESYPNMSILKPVEKCVDIDGNISMGGMRAWREVVDFVCKKLGQPPQDEDDEDDEDDNDGDEEELDQDEQADQDEEDEDQSSYSQTEADGIKTASSEKSRSEVKTAPVIDLKSEQKPKLKEEKKEPSLEIHEDLTLQPIISNRDEKKSLSNGGPESSTRHRRNTITRKELQEHEKLALQNARLNAGLGVSPIPVKPQQN
ncbi:hypothetical protein G9P44_005230 [Scheffersomyces stipitis]|nr:hypothetical protein G9P44_005230 [Scheffersomyces stipitis]